MLITTAEQLRNVTGSYYANNDFTKIESVLAAVERELATTLGLTALDGLGEEALTAARQAVGYMATMRYYRLNDISHESHGRKVKIDKDNEARPFEWQLARDDRAHLEEYYRALDRLVAALQESGEIERSRLYGRISRLIIKDADSLAYLVGTDPSPWLYLRLVPYLDESQRFVAKAYGEGFSEISESSEFSEFSEDSEISEIQHAAQMATALGALALMGRRSELQTLPYGLMKIFESDGGGNRREAAALDRLDDHLRRLSKQQRYWLNEMRQLRDEMRGEETATHLQMPDNDPRNKYMRL